MAISSVSAVNLEELKWETNNEDPPIGSEKAKRGGTYYDSISAYPLTFRLYGPNSNDAFAGWNRSYAISTFNLVLRHPSTDRFIPCLATHWSVQDDQRTIYFRLDPDARWTDGKPITADDYVFSHQFQQTKNFPLPFYNRYMEDYFESVEKIDDHTLKIVGTKRSWRPLDDYNFVPLPRHDMQTDADWPVRDNYKPPVVPGPYIISAWKEGERVEFKRREQWWGESKRYFTGMFNVDRIVLRVINQNDRAFDYFKKGELSFYPILSARMWSTQMEFDALKNGWVHRKRLFLDYPQGMYGLVMNLNTPIFQSKDFRKAVQHLFNFKELNDKLMYGAYYRQVSAFEGTEYANSKLKAYPFNPRNAREHLVKAGFSKRGRDGILEGSGGRKASFTVIFGSKTFERHMTVIQNTFKRAGIEMKLRLLEPGAAFEKGLEKAFEMQLFSRTAGFYPDPHQYFSSEFKEVKQNNNIWSFGDPEVDRLIDIYRYDLDKKKRQEAMVKIDEIIQDSAFYIPFWKAPFLRFLYWDYVQFPDTFFPKRTQQPLDYQVFWIDEDRRKRLEDAKRNNTSLGEDKVIDIDPYGVKAAMD